MKYLWNAKKSKLVEVSKLRAISIHPQGEKSKSGYKVFGWFDTHHDAFLFAEFENFEEAQGFLTQLYKELEIA